MGFAGIYDHWVRPLFHSTAFEGRSSKWAALRVSWLAEHPFCAACAGKSNLDVHHIRPVHYYPELELDANNLLTLCSHPSRNCHLLVGHSGDWSAYNPNVIEDAALMLLRRQNRLYHRKGE